MKRKNQTAKEFLLSILNEHLKFLARIKERIPRKYHNNIETEEKRTRNYRTSVTNKEVNDYDTLKNEFESEKKKFNKKIKDLEREIRRLNGVIRGKNKDIEMLQSEKKILEGTIDKLEDLMTDLSLANSDLTKRNMQEKDVEISRIYSLRSKLHRDYLREIKEFAARYCAKDAKVCKLSNENARLKEEISILKEIEVNENDEQAQTTDEDNSEQMNHWYRDQITTLNLMAIDDVTNNDRAEVYNR
ncbi:hypothetical protein F8M41_001172 [Gigaspora margarita]|uniref:Uncharacterized protein n=1 Tax=Gigaspora margarita TaxID=4874 RepID=A0A8H4AAA2_GIGMA|nr:hypothetical protein F8M41_001172 [Gigaspora margarita]